MKRSKSPEEYLNDHPEWSDELTRLRELCTNAKMEETIKWGAPTYVVDDKNVVGLGAYKSYVGLWFFQGSFLVDKKKKLMNAQEGTTRGMRQWRFKDIDDINRNAKLIVAYIIEAIQNSKDGKQIKPNRVRNKKLTIPIELMSAMEGNKSLMDRFQQLTLYKQREYAEYIDSAKREATKLSRLEKILPMIKDGKGLNDKYR